MGRVLCLVALTIGALTSRGFADEEGVPWGLLIGEAAPELAEALRGEGGMTANRLGIVPVREGTDPGSYLERFLARPQSRDTLFVFMTGRIACEERAAALVFGSGKALALPHLRRLLEGCAAHRTVLLMDLPLPGSTLRSRRAMEGFRRLLRGIEVLTAAGPGEESHRDDKGRSIFARFVARAIVGANAVGRDPLDVRQLHRTIGWDVLEWALEHGVAQSPRHFAAVPVTVPREVASEPSVPVVEVEPSLPTTVEPDTPAAPREPLEPEAKEDPPPSPLPAIEGEPTGLGIIAQDRIDPQGKALPGAMVLAVHREAPGGRGGLRADDIVLAIDGQSFAGAAALRALTRGEKAGTKVVLKVRRGQATLDLTVALTSVSPAVQVWCDTWRIERRWGMELLALDARSAYEHGAPVDRGLLLVAVRKGSPAAKVGLRSGDVLRRCAGKVPTVIGDFPVDEERIPLWIMRGTKVLELELHAE